MSTALCTDRWRCRQLARRATLTATLLVTAVVYLVTASPAAATATEFPSPSSVSSSAPSTTTPPAPTKHSYDDSDREKNVDAAGPALWILAGALTGLAVIAALLLRGGTPPREHLPRRP